jgi:mannose-1-phosphate guanylyltransferase
MSRYAVILAGGSGTRFWPVSRNSTPKQLMTLFGGRTLLEQAITRLDGLIPRENVLILTNQEQEAAVRAALPGHPAANILAEPAKRDTGPAVALGIGWVASRDPQATMCVLPADHLIKDEAAFRHTLGGAFAAAEQSGALVTIGISPTWPCPSYGYVERGADSGLPVGEGLAAHEVVRFREKPNPAQAAEFLVQGNYVWNAGMFIWTVAAATAELRRHEPTLAAFIDELAAAPDVRQPVGAKFATLEPRKSIDYVLMEKASRVLNLAATFDWSDVGGWPAMAEVFGADEAGNTLQAEVTTCESSGNIVYTSQPLRVGLLGVKDLIIVQTGDALLVADRHAADDIKKLVDLLPKDLL